MGTIFIILLVLFVISAIGIAILSPIEKKKLKRYGTALALKGASENDKMVLENIKLMYDENVIPNNEELKNLGKMENETGIAYDLVLTYWSALRERNDLLYNSIEPIDSSKYNLNLNNNEQLMYRINATEWCEEKTIKTNVSYSGVKWNMGPIRSGSLSFVSSDIKSFSILDIGRLFITNKRLLFIGKQKNISKSINIESIATYFAYQDGILLVIPNRKNILLKFKEFNPVKDGILNDGVNHFFLVMNKFISY